MSRLCVKSLLLLWCGAVAVGLTVMLNYDFTPARSIAATSQWPAGSRLKPGQNCPTLLMFIHPQCPCSRASLIELGKFASTRRSPIALRIVLIRPKKFEEGWERTSLYTLAERIPHAIVITDPDAQEAKRFGATTSGETLLYAADGRLVFQGGLTAARGHEGRSAGQDALQELIGADGSRVCRTSVFGCALGETSSPRKGSTTP